MKNRKLLKGIITLSIVITLICGFGINVFADEIEYVVDNNVLYINGTGDMTDFTYLNRPGYQTTETITKVVISDGITSIGDFTFCQMSDLVEVVLPESVVEVGKYAFYECKNLTTINPANLVSIDCYAFYGCDDLDFTTTATVKTAGVEFQGDAQSAYPVSLAKVRSMKDYLNEVYLGKYPELGFDIDYCSADDIELLQALANKITTGCTTSEQKATAIYNWMVSNIKYGSAGFSPIDVYKNREGLCSGQSQLMSALFRLSGIPAAIVRASKQGTNNIDLGTSVKYTYQYQHEFVVAYVDGDWYGYDSCWKWNKMSEEKMADQYLVQHVDGIMTGLDNWDIMSISSVVETWYVNGEFLSMSRGAVVESGGSGIQCGGCLNYYRRHVNSATDVYYTYLGTGSNLTGHAYLGGFYKVNYGNSQIICVDNNGLLETSYYNYNGDTYFNGVKVNNLIPDLGLTDNKINLYVGETFDLGEIYPGCTINAPDGRLVASGTVITAVSEGTSSIDIISGNKCYTLNFCIKNFTLDSEIQELCDHDHTHMSGSDEVCSYCGKKIEKPVATTTTESTSTPLSTTVKTIATKTITTTSTTTKTTTTSSLLNKSSIKSTSKTSIFKLKK